MIAGTHLLTWLDYLELAGVFLTLAGVVISFFQIRKIKTAAQAQRLAIDETLREVRASFGRYALSTARRQLQEAKQSVDSNDWRGAALRSGDLAEQATRLAHATLIEEPGWTEIAEGFHGWESTYRRLQRGGELPTAKMLAKWEKLVVFTAQKFSVEDSPYGPSREADRAE